jgi:hypothetical protein
MVDTLLWFLRLTIAFGLPFGSPSLLVLLIRTGLPTFTPGGEVCHHLVAGGVPWNGAPGKMTGMLCPQELELEKRRGDLHRAYMEIRNPGTAWRGAVSRPKIQQMTLDAKQRNELAEKALNEHKQVCKVCTAP